MSITITDEMVDAAFTAGLGPRSPFVFDPVYVGFDLRAALSAAAPLIEAAVREKMEEASKPGPLPTQEEIDAFVSAAKKWRAEFAAIRADGGAE
jgi:hypothetical protein